MFWVWGFGSSACNITHSSSCFLEDNSCSSLSSQQKNNLLHLNILFPRCSLETLWNMTKLFFLMHAAVDPSALSISTCLFFSAPRFFVFLLSSRTHAAAIAWINHVYQRHSLLCPPLLCLSPGFSWVPEDLLPGFDLKIMPGRGIMYSPPLTWFLLFILTPTTNYSNHRWRNHLDGARLLLFNIRKRKLSNKIQQL